MSAVLEHVVTPMNATGTATGTVVNSDIDEILSVYNRAHGQAGKNAKGALAFAELFAEAAKITHVKVQILKTVTATGLSEITTNKRKVVADWCKGIAFTSDQSVTYFAWVGRILSLPGELPEDAAVTGMVSMVMKVTTAKVDAVCSEDGMTLPRAYAKLMEMYAEAKAADVTPAKVLGQALNAVKKAAKLEAEGAEWDDKADAHLAALMAEVKALTALRVAARLESAKAAYEAAMAAAAA